MKNFFLCLVLLLLASSAPADDRIYLGMSINGQSVRFIYNTAAQQSVLFRPAAERLGLDIIARPAGDTTEECEFTAGGATTRRTFPVIDMPSYLKNDIDGVFSWAEIAPDKKLIFLLDGANHSVGLAPLPAGIAKWTKWKIVPGTHILTLEPAQKGAPPLRVGIDTGDADGVILSPDRWKQWRAARADKTSTLNASWSPATGLVITEVLRASKMDLSPLAIADVPVKLGIPAAYGPAEQHLDVVLGLFALNRIRLIIDKKNGVAYTTPSDNPAPAYDYNRIGAVFIPNNPQTDDDLIAHVAKGSPADTAGVQDGDILLKIDGLDATQWRTDSRIMPLHHFWSQPAGTQIKLRLKRGNETKEITVTLKEPDPVD